MKEEIKELLEELEGSVGATVTWADTRQRIVKLHQSPNTFEKLGLLLKIYVILMDSIEQMKLTADLDEFRETRRKDYNLLPISESTNGTNVVPSKSLAVMTREIEAGHIDKTHELYALALAGDTILTPPPPKPSWLSRPRGKG